MDYPDWAPRNLIDLHLLRIEEPDSALEPEQHIARIMKDERSKAMSSQQIETLRRNLYRSELTLPEKEGTELLGKLITDERMKNAWVSIAKRVKRENEFIHFWLACCDGVLGWRGNQKLTAIQQKKYYQKIYDLVTALSQMINDAGHFRFYSINDLIKKETVKQLLENLDAPPCYEDENKDVDYAHFLLSEVTPRAYEVFCDSAQKAIQYSKEEPSVRKPNSENAAIHYFVRSVSMYLKTRYGQPLHGVVAAATAVSLNKEDIDFDYVSKIVG